MFTTSMNHVDDTVDLEPPFGLMSAVAAASASAHVSAAADAVAIGLVCMTKQPPHLLTWLRYHREVAGIRRIFLRVEDTPALAELLSSSPWDTFVETTFVSHTQADYITQVDRQCEHVNAAIARGRECGLTHLLHIDDDELLYCTAGVGGLQRALARAPPKAASIHLDNLEALLPSDECANPFVEACAFRHKPATFCAYSNGKSMGRLDVATLSAHGVHAFTDGRFHRASAPNGVAAPHSADRFSLPAHVAVVLHYESATYSQWRRKFERLRQ